MLRLYTPNPLVKDTSLPLSESAFHHACIVMRHTSGDHLHLFNEHDGEFACVIEEKSKKGAIVRILNSIRLPLPSPTLHLVFAPLRPERMAFMIEKATELGVTDFHPLTMQHGQHHKVNIEKWRDYALHAVQQSERFTLPTFHPTQTFSMFMETSKNFTCFVALERSENSESPKTFFMKKHLNPLILVGPEGGFAEHEKLMLRSSQHMHIITLGSFILRAETAALHMISLYQGL